jgi:predicted nuclease of restriction endonuclease-like (RecB) superfamily
MVQTYFELGKRIVEHEQKGNNYSNYGDYLLENLSKELSKEFGKGFSRRKLELIRKFYITYKITKTVFSQSIGWSHYLHLMRIENEDERKFYEIEIEKNTWSVRELERQINSSLYERLSLSKDKEAILKLSQEGQTVEKAKDLIKDPYILEFLDFYDFSNYSETEFEQALINKLEHFLLELGNGFTFVGRQQRFTFDEDIFRVD